MLDRPSQLMRPRASCQNTSYYCASWCPWHKHAPHSPSYWSSTSKQGWHSWKVCEQCMLYVLWLLLMWLCCFDACVSWLHGLIDTYAEPNPDKPEVHLPIGMKSDVHCMYMDEVRCGNEELHPVSMKYFNYVWRVRVPHLKVRVFHRFPFAFMCV